MLHSPAISPSTTQVSPQSFPLQGSTIKQCIVSLIQHFNFPANILFKETHLGVNHNNIEYRPGHESVLQDCVSVEFPVQGLPPFCAFIFIGLERDFLPPPHV